MSVKKIIDVDWSDYDHMKPEEGGNYISFNEGWEQEFLKRQLFRIYPVKYQTVYDVSIAFSKKALPIPYDRKAFMEYLHKMILMNGGY